MPLFSIVIPCRNAARELPQTIASVMAQGCTDWEVVAVDDGSTDATGAILADWAAAEPRVRVIAGPRRGPSAARNAGVAASTGPIIAFLDADDLWPANRLDRLRAEFAWRPWTDALFGRVAFFDADPARPGSVSSVPIGKLSVAGLLRENAVTTMSNLAVRRTAFERAGPMREDMRHAEDVEFLIRLVATDSRVEGLDENLCAYRMSPDGLSSDLDAMLAGWRACCATASRLGVLPDPDGMAAAEAVQRRYLARRALRVGAPGRVAASYALGGAACAPLAFFTPVRRGGATFAGALLAPLMPGRLRRALFAR
jgi:glycosyltransferase involved in cell wall biosynthesis